MANAPATSITLLKSLASGTDNARWAEFFRIYEQPMRSFLQSRFPSVDADDAIQETMVALMRRMHKAEDALRREARENGKRDRLAEREETSDARSRADMRGEPEDWKLAAMNAALEQLLSDESVNARAREVFRHVALMHEQPAEVAAAFGISRTNVDQIKRRMVQRLSTLVSSMTAGE